MVPQSRLHSRKQRESLFAQARQVGTNAIKRDGTFITAKGARDFLLDFDHLNIVLGEVVVKRHVEIVQESENRVLMLTQTTQHIPSGMLLGLPR